MTSSCFFVEEVPFEYAYLHLFDIHEHLDVAQQQVEHIKLSSGFTMALLSKSVKLIIVVKISR